MKSKALVVIDIQKDISKKWRETINNINEAIDWAVANGVHVVYTRHENLSPGSKLLLPGTVGAELSSDLKIVSDNIFTKNKMNCLTCEEFVDFIKQNEISEFILAGADATICVKSTCFNLCKLSYDVTVLSDCIASWKPALVPEMLSYYEKQGAKVIKSSDL
jgi:nicotinamidase-related amidase